MTNVQFVSKYYNYDDFEKLIMNKYINDSYYNESYSKLINLVKTIIKIETNERN